MLCTLTALVARILANPVANLLQKRLTAESGERDVASGGVADKASGVGGLSPEIVNLTTYLLLSAACILPAIGFFSATSLHRASLPPAFWCNCLLVGLFGGVGNALLIKALQCGELSILGPINSWKSVVGLIVGVIVLGELPNAWGLLGVVLIISGSYFVLVRPGDRFTPRLLTRRDIRFRLFAMIFTAIEAVFIKRLILLSSPAVAFVAWCWFGALASAIIVLAHSRSKTRTPLKIPSPRTCLSLLAVASCVGLAQYSTNIVFASMDVGYALALFQLSAVVSVLLGYKVFNEGAIARKLTGSAIMIAGSALIIILS